MTKLYILSLIIVITGIFTSCTFEDTKMASSGDNNMRILYQSQWDGDFESVTVIDQGTQQISYILDSSGIISSVNYKGVIEKIKNSCQAQFLDASMALCNNEIKHIPSGKSFNVDAFSKVSGVSNGSTDRIMYVYDSIEKILTIADTGLQTPADDNSTLMLWKKGNKDILFISGNGLKEFGRITLPGELISFSSNEDNVYFLYKINSGVGVIEVSLDYFEEITRYELSVEDGSTPTDIAADSYGRVMLFNHDNAKSRIIDFADGTETIIELPSKPEEIICNGDKKVFILVSENKTELIEVKDNGQIKISEGSQR
jgi:hypothetical protein